MAVVITADMHKVPMKMALDLPADMGITMDTIHMGMQTPPVTDTQIAITTMGTVTRDITGKLTRLFTVPSETDS